MQATSATLGGLPAASNRSRNAASGGLCWTAGHRRHIQGGADRRPATPRASAPPLAAAVTVERRHSDQGGHLLPGQSAQFGQVRRQRRRHHRPDPRHAHQQQRRRPPGRARGDAPRRSGVLARPAARPTTPGGSRSMGAPPRGRPAPAGSRPCAVRPPAAAAPPMPSGRHPRASGRPRFGRTAAANRANSAASSASVLASCPTALAKSRAWRGLTTATGTPRARSSAATAPRTRRGLQYHQRRP